MTAQARRPGRMPGTRRSKIALAAAVLVAAIAAGVTVAATSSAGRPRALPAAPALHLPGLGHPGIVSLSALAGRPVIVNFFASWCAPCKRETPVIARFYDRHHGQVRVIGVDSNDQAAAAIRFLRAAGVRYPVGSDPYPATTTTAWGVLGLPQTFFLNSRHRIARHLLGPVTSATLAAGAALIERHPGPAAAADTTR